MIKIKNKAMVSNSKYQIAYSNTFHIINNNK